MANANDLFVRPANISSQLPRATLVGWLAAGRLCRSIKASNHGTVGQRAFLYWSGTPIGDKLRSECSCQAGLSGWLKEKLSALLDLIRF